MQYWNSVVMYAPHTPDRYAIQGVDHCIFRLMHKHGDTQAWNLYWLSKPDTDALLAQHSAWLTGYESMSPEQTEAFYEALDTPVFNHLTLATLVAQGPREAMRLLRQARLERTRFYRMAGGEQWRNTMLARLFSAARHMTESRPQERDADVVYIDFAVHRHHRSDGTRG